MNAPLPKDQELYFASIEVAMNHKKYAEEFHDWLMTNWHIYLAFAREADKVWARGRTNYSHRTIWEYLRHETLLREASGEYKLNDHFTKSCALLYIFFNPKAKGFFNFRDQHK